MHRFPVAWTAVTLALGGLASLAAAQPPAKSVPTSQLAVDVVSLKTGRSLRGAILSRQPDGATSIAVSRSWLEKANPALFTQYDAAARTAQREAWTQSRDRVKALLETPPEAPRYVFFLKEELVRLDKQLTAEEPKLSPFLVIDLPGSAISKVTPASPDRQRLALLAWNEDWADVETRDAAALRIELVKHNIKLDGPAPDLSGRLPARPQDDREWAARLAVLEYTYRQPVDFQGTGDTLIRTGSDQKPDLSAVFQKLLKQQVDSVLQDLLSDGARPKIAAKPDREWLAPAITAAKAANAKGFRVTHVQLDPQSSRVAVETRFVARLAEGDWQTVWLATELADGTVPRPDIEARIEQDPQVKSALASLKTLGVIDDAPIRQAVRTGAATMAAQQASDSAFFAFADRYAKRIDSPRLVVPGK
ncbi:MAG TPA: hypothetical protein VM165_03315 [Planctomycetaceae bacterium]|nr:hypothetical protein [Planctomycetaceae bacterium]